LKKGGAYLRGGRPRRGGIDPGKKKRKKNYRRLIIAYKECALG